MSADGGLPAVVGRRPGPPGAPTVLLYAHHDVQPVGRPERLDERAVRARWSATGGCTAAGPPTTRPASRCTAPRCARSADDLAVGVTVLVEGEEEIGSPTLPALLEAHRDRLAADVLVLADSTNWRVGVPALTTTLRGGVNVRRRGADARPRGAQRRVRRRGAGRAHRPGPAAGDPARRPRATSPSRAWPAQPADPLDLTEERLRADAGVLDGRRADRHRPAHRPGCGPPPRSRSSGSTRRRSTAAGMVLVPSARARLTLRIAPGRRPGRGPAARSSAHLEAHAPWGARVTVSAGEPVAPFRPDTTGPAYDAARAAYAEAWGRRAGRDRRRRLDRVPGAASPARSPMRRSSSPGSRTPTPARTRPTRACTWATSRAPAWRRRCCCARSAEGAIFHKILEHSSESAVRR